MGDNLDHEVQFRLSDDSANDEIIDTQPITAGPGDCFYVVNPTWVSCPAHAAVRADLGAGNDSVTTARDCFDAYKGKKLGAGRKTLKKAGTARVVVRIAKKSRAKVRRLKGKKLTLRLKVTASGKTTTLSRKVTLKR